MIINLDMYIIQCPKQDKFLLESHFLNYILYKNIKICIVELRLYELVGGQIYIISPLQLSFLRGLKFLKLDCPRAV